MLMVLFYFCKLKNVYLDIFWSGYDVCYYSLFYFINNSNKKNCFSVLYSQLIPPILDTTF